MAEKKGFLRRLMSAVPGTDANKEANAEEQAIRDRATASVAAYEQRTGDKFVPEKGIEEDRVSTAIMDLPLAGPMSLPNVGKTLARMAVGGGVRDAMKKADPDLDRKMRIRWNSMNEKTMKEAGYKPSEFEKFKKDQIKAEQMLDAQASNAKEALKQSPGTANLKETDVSDMYAKTKEVARPMEDMKVISTPKRLADMSSNVPPAKASAGPSVVKEVEFPKYEGMSTQQILEIQRKMKDRGL